MDFSQEINQPRERFVATKSLPNVSEEFASSTPNHGGTKRRFDVSGLNEQLFQNSTMSPVLPALLCGSHLHPSESFECSPLHIQGRAFMPDSYANSGKLEKSFWAAFKSDYDFIMQGNLMDGCQEMSDEAVDTVQRNKIDLLMDLFCEQCSMLHRDFCDALRDITQLTEEEYELLSFRHVQLTKQAEVLLQQFFEMVGEEVKNRIKLVDSVYNQMTSAFSSRNDNSANSDDSNCSGSLNQLRKYLQNAETKIGSVETRHANADWCDVPALNQLLVEYKQILNDVQRDGGQLVSALCRLLTSDPGQRRQLQFSALERRWHTLVLHLLECQLWLEEQIHKLAEDQLPSVESESECGEPSAKRSRLLEEDQSFYDDENNSEQEDDIYCPESDEGSICSGAQYESDAGGDELCTDFLVSYHNTTRTRKEHCSPPPLSDSEFDSDISDTIPFAACEYEKITPSPVLQPCHCNNTDHQNMDEIETTTTDGGMTVDLNGNRIVNENAAGHDLDNNKTSVGDDDRADGFLDTDYYRQRLDATPIKLYYQMTPPNLLDVLTDVDSPRTVVTVASSGIGSTVATTNSVSTDSLNNIIAPSRNSERREEVSNYGHQTNNIASPSDSELPPNATMTDSMTVNVGDNMTNSFCQQRTSELEEVLDLLEQSPEDQFSALDRFYAELCGGSAAKGSGHGTTWTPFKGSASGHHKSSQNGRKMSSKSSPVAATITPTTSPSGNPHSLDSVSLTPRSILNKKQQHTTVPSKVLFGSQLGMSPMDQEERDRNNHSSCYASGEISCENDGISDTDTDKLLMPPTEQRLGTGSEKLQRLKNCKLTLSCNNNNNGSSAFFGEMLTSLCHGIDCSARVYLLRNNGSLKRRRRRRSERPLSLNTSLRLFGDSRASELFDQETSLTASMIANHTANFDKLPCSMAMDTVSSALLDVPREMTVSISNNASANSTPKSNKRCGKLLERSYVSASCSQADKFDLSSRLRAWRRLMPRSKSYGEQLSFPLEKPLSGLERSQEPACHELGNSAAANQTPNYPLQPPPTPATTPVCGDKTNITNCDAVSNSDVSDIEEAFPERLAGDGGSISEPEQSETVWEWDDYKPPNHNEGGIPEQPLDVSELAEFGEDYQCFLESSPQSKGVKAACPGRNTVPRFKRLSPVGLSHDSDSELDEMFRLIKCSQKEIEQVRRTTRFDSATVPNKVDKALLICNKNIEALQRAGGIFLSVGNKARNGDYAFVSELLKDWIKLHRELTTMYRRARHDSERQDRISRSQRSTTGDEDLSSIQREVRQLTESLQNIMKEGSLNRSLTTGQYVSFDDLIHAINLCKDLESRLRSEKDRLVSLSSAFDSDSGVEGSDIFDELRHLCDSALDECHVHCRELEAAAEGWEQWNDTLRCVQQLISGLEAKLQFLEEHCGAGPRKQTSSLSIPDFKAVLNDMQFCEDRLRRLHCLTENICSGLVAADLERDCRNFQCILQQLRERLTLVAADQACTCHKEEFEETNNGPVCSQKMLARQRKLARAKRKCSRSTATVEQNQQKRNQTATKSSGGIMRSFWRSLRYSWPLQICCIFLVCLGAYCIQPLCCGEYKNSWRSSFGPQLEHTKPPST